MKWKKGGRYSVLLVIIFFLFGAFSTASAQHFPIVGFPDADPDSGRFIDVTRGMSTLGDTGDYQNVLNLSLAVDPGLSEFELRIFDGDSDGEWDRVYCANPDKIIFKLYQDPLGDGSTDSGDLLWTWESGTMIDDDWCWLTEGNPVTKEGIVNCDPNNILPNHLPNVSQAYNSERETNLYHLVADWATTNCADQGQFFKVATEGFPFLKAGSTVGFQAMALNPDAIPPEYVHLFPLANTSYDGTFSFSFYVPDSGTADEMVFIDGDVDRADDTEDPNTPSEECHGAYVGSVEDPDGDPTNGPFFNDQAACGFPPFQTSPFTFAEGAIPGDPLDDNSEYAAGTFSPNVFYTITGPDGWAVTNDNPSGDQEWEVFRVGIAGVENVDERVLAIPSGPYKWQFQGLDPFNNILVRAEFDLLPANGGLGDFVWNDLDKDGIQDPDEPGIEGVRVGLYFEGHKIGEKFTSASGVYTFNIIAPGEYTVKLDGANFDVGQPLANMIASPMDNPATSDARDSDGDLYTHEIKATVVEGEVNRTLDFGFYAGTVERALLGDYVWSDLNENGIQETGEPGIEGVLIEQYDPQGSLVNYTTSLVGGLYYLPIYENTTYTVKIAGDNFGPGRALDGLTASPQDVGSDDEKDSDGNIATNDVDVDVTTDSDNFSVDFGFYEKECECIGATSITFKNIDNEKVDLQFYDGTQLNHNSTAFAVFNDVPPGDEVTLDATDYFTNGVFPEWVYNHGEGCHWDWDIQFSCDDQLPVGTKSPDTEWGQKIQVTDVVWGDDCCKLEIDKTCSTSTGGGDMLCESAIASTTLRYIGPDIADATVVFAGKDNGYAKYANVVLTNGTILADQNGWTIESSKLGSKTTITITDNDTGTDYVEIIHTSCSAVYVAGQPAPLDGDSPPRGSYDKGDPSPTWFVVGFEDKDGNTVAAGPVFNDECTISSVPGEVTYRYKVTNISSYTATSIAIVDDKLGPIGMIDSLEEGESETFELGPVSINEDTTNIATAEAFEGCIAEDSVTVTVSEEDDGCRVTGGGNDKFGKNRYQFGGQAGANTALQPQPKGNWTHKQSKGPDGKFVFHAGTNSAPQGTEIDVILCSDPGGCGPSGDPPSPAKQIDFAGVGTFKNIKKPSAALAGVIPKRTYHWFEVHMEDLGEPGKGKKGDKGYCPEGGSGTDAFADPPVFEAADCECPDFYRIRIFEGVIPEFDSDTGDVTNLNKDDIIYEVYGYIDGGNLQIHKLTGFDTKKKK